MRLLAAERATAEDPPEEHTLAIQRAITYYTVAMHRVEGSLGMTREMPFGPPEVPDWLARIEFVTPTAAHAWVEQELPCLVALIVPLSQLSQRTRLAIWFADALWPMLDARCDWAAAYRLTRQVLEAALRDGSAELIGWATHRHGCSEACLGNYQAASDLFERASTLLRRHGTPMSIALTLNGQGILANRQGIRSRRWCGLARRIR